MPKSGARFVFKCGRTYANRKSSGRRSQNAEEDKENDGEYVGALEEDKENSNLPLSFKKVAWKYDSRNSRSKGSKPLLRNTSTSLPMTSDETCKFAIKVYHDCKSYFVSPRFGCAIQLHHPYIGILHFVSCFLPPLSHTI